MAIGLVSKEGEPQLDSKNPENGLVIGVSKLGRRLLANDRELSPKDTAESRWLL